MQSSTAITSTDFVLDERGALTHILGAVRSDATEELYAYGPEGGAAQRTIESGTPQDVVYPLLDGLGSLRHLTDASGALVLSRHYDAWGNVRHSSGSASTRLGFTGELVDGATGLVYLRARHYSPALGRFLQRDTFPGIPERPQSLNRFAYTENNPANWTDPSGKLVFIPVLLAAWVVVEIGLQIYDTYDTIRTVLDPCVSGWEKGAVVGMYVTGLFLPGGGYGTATKQGFRWFRRVDQAENAVQASHKLLRQTDQRRPLQARPRL